MTHVEAKKRHAELSAEIRRHDHAYYVEGEAKISDHEYDLLFKELQELEKSFPDLVTPESPTQRWLIIDTETDGLTAPIHVIEIAAQMMEGWKPFGRPFQIYLNHGVDIPPEATAIHGYTKEFLDEHGRSPVEAHAAFRKYARGYPIVAHNLAYDWNRALEPEWMRLGLPSIGRRGFCTMLLARRVLTGIASFRLDALKLHFRVDSGRSHKAFNDVQAVVSLFTVVIKPRLEFAGLTTFPEWVEFSRQQPISKCLLQTNPQQNPNRVQTYYLDARKSEEQPKFISQKSSDLKQILKQLGKQIKTDGELSVESIRSLKSMSDASESQLYQRWVHRWLERVIWESQIDATEKMTFEAALINRLRKPKPEWEFFSSDIVTEGKMIFDKPKTITIMGHSFCFTGKAAFGTRTQCEIAVVERGGVCDKRPQPSTEFSGTDYLVVGSLWNPNGKYEAAVELKNRGDPILLITEQAWLSAVQQTAKLPSSLQLKTSPKIPRKRLPRPATKSSYGGISVTIGMELTRIERIPFQAPPNETKL